MRTLSVSDFLKKTTLFIALAGIVTIFASATIGIDSYEIYLNNKLIMKQEVTKPLALSSLKLTDANINDRLAIKYNHCNEPEKNGRGRSISLRDDSGKIIKEWKFENPGQHNALMEIPVKELLEAQKKTGESLVIFYSAEGLSHGQKLAAL